MSIGESPFGKLPPFDASVERVCEPGGIDFEAVFERVAARDALIATVRDVIERWQHPDRNGIYLGDAAALRMIRDALDKHDEQTDHTHTGA